MAVDTTDGCINSKMNPAEEMEVGSGGHEESQNSQDQVATSYQLIETQPATSLLTL